MKLKTLNDLDCKGCALLPKIKEEAIKWVKNGMYTEHDFRLFHNITEEDLKSEDKQ